MRTIAGNPMTGLPEVWLRGPIEGVPPTVQPIAHALLQSVEEVDRLVAGLPDAVLWTRPGGVASAGFHLQHLSGVLDRLFTYARGEALSESQRDALRREGDSSAAGDADAAVLAERFRAQVEVAISQLRATSEAALSEPRSVGRARLPSTVLGLLAHAAEHTQRHVGQLLVTVRVQTGVAE